MRGLVRLEDVSRLQVVSGKGGTGKTTVAAALALALATELEGHPDNVAPALFGSLTIAWMTPDGPQHKRLMVHRGVSPLVSHRQ